MKKPQIPRQDVMGPLWGHQTDGQVVLASSGPVSYDYGVFTSVKTPGFKTMPRWNLPVNPFENTVQEHRFPSGSFGGPFFNGTTTVWAGYSGQIWSMWLYMQVADEPVASDEAQRMALTKILNKLKDSSVNLAQAFAERKQTVNLITKRINTIATAALAVRNGRLSHAVTLFGREVPRNSRKRLLQDVKASPSNLHNYWLEYQYGWRPLLSDIYGAAELIAKTYAQQRSTIVSAQAKTQYRKEILTHKAIWGNFRYPLYQDFTINDTYRYVIAFREDNAIAARLSQTGISNPLLLAWELVPYSFVVDWMLPVGSYLSQLDATQGLLFQGGSASRYTETFRQFRFGEQEAGDRPCKVIGNNASWNKWSKVRIGLNNFPASSFPTFSPKLGVERALSGIALLAQAFRH